MFCHPVVRVGVEDFHDTCSNLHFDELVYRLVELVEQKEDLTL